MLFRSKEQAWGAGAKFECIDINQLLNRLANAGVRYDTIIAFEILEYIGNGLEVAQQLKQFCNRLIVTVPYNESPGAFNSRHVLYNLTILNFSEFQPIALIDKEGNFYYHDNLDWSVEHNFLMTWNSPVDVVSKPNSIAWLQQESEEIYKEVVIENCYDVSEVNMAGRTVIDVGANIGVFSILASSLGAKNVIAVEPVSSTYERLTKNVQDRKSTRLNSSHSQQSRMPSSA